MRFWAIAAVAAAIPWAPAGALCIQDYRIQSTEVKSDSVILFHMNDGTTYQNTLPYPCVGLKAASDGFTYSPTNPGSDELCDNLADFRVNDGGGPGINTGQVCLFGAFKKL